MWCDTWGIQIGADGENLPGWWKLRPAQALRIALEVLWWVLEPEKDLGLELAFLCYF